MPRLFGFLIYVLGARTIESQIAVTFLVVGSATLLAAYHGVARLVSPLFATVFCLLFFTDYILVAEWHVVTYRVWYGFLFFTALVCVVEAGGERWRRWAVLQGAVFFLAFYFELVNAVMLGVVFAAFGAFLHRRRPRRAAALVLAEGIGAALALGLLFGQLAAVFGLHDVVRDFELTLHARNAATDPAFARELHAFYASRNIAFWYNLVDGDRYRSLGALVRSESWYVYQVYTPVLLLMAVLPVVGFACGAAVDAVRRRGLRLARAEVLARNRRLVDMAAALVLVLAAVLLCLIPDARFHGIAREGGASAGRLIGPLLGLALAGGVAMLWRRAVRRPLARLSSWRYARRAAPYIATVALVGWLWPRPFDQEFALLWTAAFPSAAWRWGLALGLVAAFLSGLTLACLGARAALGQGRLRGVGSVVVLFVVCQAAYAAVYWLSPGYVLTGYAWRYAAFAVYFAALLPALGAYLVVVVALRSLAALRAGWHRRRLQRRRLVPPSLPAAGSLAAAVLATVVLAAAWAELQATYATLLPPDQYAGIRRLRAPPFAGASFVVGNYAAPVAAMTHQWAYLDLRIGRVFTEVTPEGIVLGRDATSYLWLADRATNTAYREPDYFMCLVRPTLRSVLATLDPAGFKDPNGRCANLGLVEIAAEGIGPFTHRLVAEDDTRRDNWAIVKLDNDTHPVIERIAAQLQVIDGRPQLSLQATIGSPRLIRLLPPRIEVFAHPGAPVCRPSDEGERVALSEDGRPVMLPWPFTGSVFVRVTPRTTVNEGPPLWLPGLRHADDPGTDGKEPRWDMCPYHIAIDATGRGNFATFAAGGWSGLEEEGRWSEGRKAALVIPDLGTPPGPLLLTLEAHGYVPRAHPTQRISLAFDGHPIGTLTMIHGEAARSYRLVVPADSVASGARTISFAIADPLSPADVGESDDARKLGIFVSRVAVDELPSAQVPAYSPGSDIDFRAGGNAPAYELSGWAAPEAAGTWMLGSDATLLFRLGAPVDHDLTLYLEGTSFFTESRAPQAAELSLNGQPIGRVSFDTKGASAAKLVVPRSLLAGSTTIVLRIAGEPAVSPHQLGMSDDERPLSLNLRRMRFE